MRVATMLAQFANVTNNQISIFNGGADVIFQMTPFAVAAIVYVAWDETNQRHEIRFELIDAGSGNPVAVNPGSPPLVSVLPFELGRPPGAPRGMTFQLSIALNIGPLMLTPGRYEWRVTVDGQGNVDWNVQFDLRAAPAQIIQPPPPPPAQ